jgi:hypothetical protein
LGGEPGDGLALGFEAEREDLPMRLQRDAERFEHIALSNTIMTAAQQSSMAAKAQASW